MRSYEELSDHDFELFVADLFGTVENERYEVFARGPDLGIDLRHEHKNGTLDVIQCKHYIHSSMSDLRAAARKEAHRLGTCQ